MAMLTVRRSYTCTPEEEASLREYAESLDRSINWALRSAIRAIVATGPQQDTAVRLPAGLPR